MIRAFLPIFYLVGAFLPDALFGLIQFVSLQDADSGWENHPW
jgi:hypothetical protein